MQRRSSPSITSATNRARWRCGSHSSTDGGIRKSMSRLIGRKLLMRLGPARGANRVRRFYRPLPHRAKSDRLLVGTKSYSLSEAMDHFAPAVGPTSVILPILNGMSHLKTLSDRFGSGHV